MKFDLRRSPAAMAIAGVTILVSLAIEFLGLGQVAALHAGFVPGRASLGFAGDLPGLVPVILTPLSSALIHGGLIHLMFNMVMLLYIGNATERAVGAPAVVVLYIVGAYAAAFAQWLADPGSAVPMVGASGAVSALVGAYSLLYGRQKTKDVGPIPGWLLHVVWLATAWTLINLMIGMLSWRAGTPIAAAAHVGGFIAGLILCRPLLMWRWRKA